MAKCDDCKHLIHLPVCALTRVLLQYTVWFKDEHSCKNHKFRETPLLVDALAAALRTIRNEDRLCELVAEGRDNFNESMLVLLDHMFPNIEPALARYKEEVGDA